MIIKKSRSMLRQFVLSYMAVLTVFFLLISACSCLISVQYAREELHRESTSLLEESKNTIDLQIEALMNLRIPLVIRDNVLDFESLTRPLPPQVYPALKELNGRLSSYNMMNNFADSLMLYFKSNQVFVSNKAIGTYSEAFYNGWLDYYDMEYIEWNELVLARGETYILSNYGSDKPPVMEIVSNLPTTSRANNTVIIFTLTGERINSVFHSFGRYGEAFFSITDSGGTVHYSNAEPEQLQWLSEGSRSAGRYLQYQDSSSILDMTYTVYIPKSATYRQSLQLLKTYLLIYVLLIGLCGLLFALITYHNTQPLRRTVHRIAQRQGINLDKAECEVDFINSAFSDLYEDVEQLEEKIRTNFMEKLLKGIPLTEGEIQCLDERSSTIFNFDQYIAVVLWIDTVVGDGPKEQFVATSSMQRIMLEQMERAAPENAYVHPVEYDKVAVIFGYCSKVNREPMEKWLQKLLEDLGLMNIHAVCAVGDVHTMCDQVYLSYQNACWLLQSEGRAHFQPIRWFQEQTLPMDHYYYPQDIQGRLRNQILEGRIHEAEETLAGLFEQNYAILQLPEQERALFNDVLCNDLQLLKKHIGSLGEEREQFHYLISQIKHNQYHKNNLKYCQMLAQILARCAQGRKEEQENELVQQVQDLIQQRYGDPCLGLAAIAGHFDLNENYLSTFYKQQTGENLSAFIESCRMAHAVEYITDDKLSIKDIAEQVGYSNLNTFYKAFKRRFGVPPKRYKELLLQKN